MKPSRAYHAVTAYHREPGGLRRLDFFVDRIRAAFPDRDEGSVKILDIGCGKGNIALPLAWLGYDVTGVDYDRASVEDARSQAASSSIRATFLEGSLARVAGTTFDVIIASEVLEHQKDTSAFLADIAARLAPDGLLLLSVPNGKSLEERLRRFTTHTRAGRALKRAIKRRLRSEDVQSAAAHPHEQFFSWKALQDVLHASGWRTTEADGAAAAFKEFFYLGGKVFLRRGSRIFHLLDALDGFLAPRLPMSVADGWLLEAVRFDSDRPFVLHVVPTLNAGGAERLVYEIVSRLPASGFDAEAVALFGGGPLEPLFRANGVPLTAFERRGPFGVGTYRRLRHRIGLLRPDVVHTHLFGADVLGRVAARRAGVSVIVSTEHNVNADHGRLKRMIKSLLARITSVFIAVSDETKTYMVASEGIPKGKIRVVRNGIDMSRIPSRPPGPFHDVPRLITVGRLSPQKDQATLLKALALVKRPWRLLIVGSGDLEKPLRDLAERLSLSPRIEWLGFRDDVPALLAESDLFCFPSKWEGLGLALLEAAAAGVPVVASDLPVFREVLSDDEATYVGAADVPAWARAIERMIDDPSAAVARAASAAAEVRRRFSIERMIDGYVRIYREHLSRRRV